MDSERRIRERLAWADEIRAAEGMPPRGDTPEAAQAREAVARFVEVVGVQPEVTGSHGGAVFLEAHTCRFSVRTGDGALFFHPTDSDGVTYGQPTRFESRRELVPLLEKQYGINTLA